MKQALHSITSRPVLQFAFVLSVATALLCVFSLPILVHTFGFSDDFIAWMWFTTPHFDPLKGVMTQDGRYILALLTKLGFGQWTELSEFVWLRLISVIGWGFFAALLYGWVLPKERSALARMAYTAAIVLTPATGVCIAFAVCFPYSWGSALALVSGMLVVESNRAGVSWAKRLSLLFVSISLLQVAFLIYQPVAFFFLLPPLIHFRSIQFKRPLQCRWLRSMGAFAFGLGVYVLIYLFFKSTTGSGASRGSLGSLSVERLIDIAYFIWKGLESWAAFLPLWLSIPTTGAVAGFAIYGCISERSRWAALFTVLATISLPLALENVEFFVRVLVVTYPVVAYLAVEGFFVWVRTRTGGWGDASRMFASASVVIFVGAVFSYYTYQGLVRSSVNELRWIEQQAADLEAPAEQIYFVMPWNEGQAQAWVGRPLIEYGYPISVVSPNAEALIAYAHKQRFPNHAPNRFFNGKIVYLEPKEFEALNKEGNIPSDVTILRGDQYHVLQAY